PHARWRPGPGAGFLRPDGEAASHGPHDCRLRAGDGRGCGRRLSGPHRGYRPRHRCGRQPRHDRPPARPHPARPGGAMSDPSELTHMAAQAVVRLLRQGRVSPLELIDAALARVEATDGTLNALPTLCADRARDRARRLMESASAVAPGPGWLGGLPLAVKDLNDVAGVRTTYGSPIYADNVPARSDILVERLEANGGV